MRIFDVPPVLAAMLWSRGFPAVHAASTLAPAFEPSAIPTLDAAAERLALALDRGERILVHGDYDADGITGSAVLLLGLRALGGQVEVHLPNRLTHGYGIHPDLVPAHAERSDLFITVDCGITNLDEVAALRALGSDVIVTDHHTPREDLPDALIVHPRLARDGRTMREHVHGVVEPTGSGVAYHLLWRLHERLGLEAPLHLIDVAAIGTVADVAPLLGENRALVMAGLDRLADSSWPGVRAMIAQSRIKGAPTARDVAFALAPRLNASGRLGEPEAGLELLTSTSERRARELAVYLDGLNAERRAVQDRMYDEALGMVNPGDPAIVIGHDDWHPGVMGIVASKLLERTFKPVFIMAKGQGSVRSTPGISAVDALEAAAPALKRFGGHAAAAGFKLRTGAEQQLRDHLFEFVSGFPTPVPEVVADAVLEPWQVHDDVWRGVQQLEPFGEAHAPPTFALTGDLRRARAVGKGSQHLQLLVEDVKGVAWGLGDVAADLRLGEAVQTAAALQENVWQDRRSIEFVASHVRSSARLTVETRGATASVAPANPEIVRDAASQDVDAVPLTSIPVGDDPEEAHLPLQRVLLEAARVHVDLDADAQRALREAAVRFPTLHEVRSAYVALRRRATPRLGPLARARADRILEELGLLDENGLVLQGEKRDPYTSPTLRACLTQRYRFETLYTAYRHLDDAAFAQAVRTLFLEPDGAPDPIA